MQDFVHQQYYDFLIEVLKKVGFWGGGGKVGSKETAKGRVHVQFGRLLMAYVFFKRFATVFL